MTQQSKIAAALTRAGITKPEAWSAAGVPYKTAVVEENAPVPLREERGSREPRLQPTPTQTANFDLMPQIVMMKGPENSIFVISFRSQIASVTRLKWKSCVMTWAGAAITLLGVYALLLQMKWL